MNAQDLGLIPVKLPVVLEGKYRRIMKQLVDADLPVWGPDDILRLKNNVVGTAYQDAAWNNYFFTDFGIAATTDKIILQPHSTLLHSVTPETKLVSYGLPLTDEQLAQTQQYSRQDMILNQHLTEEQARVHLGWLVLTNKDQKLLDKTVENTFRLGKEKGYDQMMGFYVPQDSNPIMRAVVLDSVNSRSSACGYNNLSYFARLVGGSPISAVGAAKKNGIPSTPLEIVLSRHGISDPAQLNKVLQLYTAAKKLNI